MIEPPKNFNFTAEQIYMLLGFASAFLSSGVRLMRDKENFSSVYAIVRSKIDAFTCALLSYGVFLILHQYWLVDSSVLVFIGTFVGSLGSNTIISFVSTLLKKYIEKK